MTDRDNITLPREVVQEAVKALEFAERNHDGEQSLYTTEIAALRKALAAEQQEPVADEEAPRLWAWMREGWSADCGPWYEVIRNDQMTWRDRKGWTPLYTALAAEPTKQEAKQEPVAYFDLQKQVFYWARPTMIDVPMTIALEPLPLYAAPPDAEALRRDAERYKWVLNWLWRYGLLSREKTRIDTPESYGDWWILRKPKVIDGSSLLGYGKTEDAAIDAAMEEKR